MSIAFQPNLSVSIQTPWRSLSTQISEATWVQELRKKGAIDSPLFNGEADREAAARLIYRWIKTQGECAELMLAICGREHSWGTNPNSVLHRHDTRSFTNARSLRNPGVWGQEIYDQQRDGTYIKYANAMGSVQDGFYRLHEAGYAYDKTVTIADLFKVWAPREDANDPSSYAQWVCDYIIGLRSRELDPTQGGDLPVWTWVGAAADHFERGRTIAWPDLLIFHHTDGFDSLNWLTRTSRPAVSAHHLLNHDGSHRAQLVKHEDTAWTTGRVNYRSIGTEWERHWASQVEISAAQYRRIAEHAANMTRFERARGNPHFAGTPQRSQLRDHNDFYNTTCPGNLDTGRIYDEMAVILETKPGLPAGVRYIEQTGKALSGGFKGFYEELEALPRDVLGRVLGPPVVNEGWAMLGGSRVRVQKFVKGWLIWNEQLAEPYHITVLNESDEDRLEAFVEEEVAA